jgi:hypothetical protein
MPQRDPVTGRFVKSSAATPPPPAGAPPVSASGEVAVPAARKSVAEISAELQAVLDEGGNAMEQMAAKQVQAKAKAAQMEIGNRTLKVEAMVKLLREHKISAADAKRMNAEQWGNVAEAAGQKKPSAATQLQTIIELEKAPTASQPARFVAPSRTLKSEEGYIYHATTDERLADIVSSGKLKTHKPSYGTDQNVWPDGSVEKRSYWSQTADNVWQFAPEGGRPVIVRTKRSPLFKKESTGDIYSSQSVPATWVEVLTDEGWIPLEKVK